MKTLLFAMFVALLMVGCGEDENLAARVEELEKQGLDKQGLAEIEKLKGQHANLSTRLGKQHLAEIDELKAQYLAEIDELEDQYADLIARLAEAEENPRLLGLKIQSSQADLANEKEERQNEKETFETEIKNLKDLAAQLEQEKQDLDKQRLAEIDELKAQHGTKVNELTREIQLAEKRGYQNGVDYMMKKQIGTKKTPRQ